MLAKHPHNLAQYKLIILALGKNYDSWKFVNKVLTVSWGIFIGIYVADL